MSLHYPFPVIRNISDVLPHIDEHFRVVEKDGLTFINYNQMGPDVFPPVLHAASVNVHTHGSAHRAAVRRECRGITFDTATGDIVSRPFHKFFNAGEREDVSLDKIDVSRPHHLVEKLDGSMIRPLRMGSGFRWGTKMGVTDVGMLAEEFVAKRISEGDTSYVHLAEFCHGMYATPLFEFCSRRSRIVVDYPEETMVLLAIRFNESGEYLDRYHVRGIAGTAGVPVVDYVDASARQRPVDTQSIEGVADLDKVMGSIRASEEGEGKILVFNDGHAVKIKSDWYVRVHRAKDMMCSEMRLLDLFFNDELDDLMATVDAADRARIESYLATFDNEANHLADRIDVTYRHIRASFETKKDFAVSVYGREVISAPFKSLMFSLWDGKLEDANDATRAVIRNALTSESKFAAMKASMELETGWDNVWANDMEEAA